MQDEEKGKGNGKGQQNTFNVDGWENLTTGLGMSTRDKRLGRRIKVPGYAMSAEIYDSLFTSSDVAATIAELPAREMVREWISVYAEDPSTEETEDRGEIVSGVMSRLDELDAQEHIFSAKLWSRVYGGSLIFLGIDDGQDISQPLNEDRVRSFDSLTVFDRFEVSIVDWYRDVKADGPKYGLPKIYRTQDTKSPTVPIMPQDIHETRLIRLDGVKTTRRRMIRNGGWADSIYARLEELIGDYEESWQGMFHLIQDFAQMVYKIRGLAAALTADEEGRVINKLMHMDLCRSLVRGIPMDAENEEAQRLSTPVSGLPELLDRGSLRLAQAARMPVTLLMGQSPAGMNATGASDISFFYDQIKAAQEAELRKPINRILKLIFKSATGPTRGKEPENWSFEFNPLWQLDDKEEAEIRKIQAETDAIYIEQGVVYEKEIAKSRFGGDKYSSETVLDPVLREEEETIEEDRQRSLKEAPSEETPPVAIQQPAVDDDEGGG